MSFSPEAVKRIVYSAAEFLTEHEDATVSEGLRYGISVELVQSERKEWWNPALRTALNRLERQQ